MGTLYLVSTPIGNLEDITIRALKTLFSVDLIACEDTRVTGQLLELLKKKYATLLSSDKKPAFISYRDTNEQTIAAELIHELELQKNVALVTDAGTPLVSDPGFRIVTQAQKRNIPIVVVPGASAFLTALTGSGLSANTFMFL
ncbi:SAM-dependent methyltransferase, partial [Patescibacteria group bacterium]|nr:SAM-dependent methyltransferase [Patescibacteria group bacterium]